MQPELARTAFTLAPVHRRRDERRVTAVALHQKAGRVYLGLDNGVLEEHRLVPLAAPQPQTHPPHAQHHAAGPPAPQQALGLRLSAERHLFRSPVAALAVALPAARVAALSEDGQLLLVSLESFHLAGVPGSRGAVAVAADPSGRFPAQLAVGVRLSKGRSRVGVYDVIPGSATQSGAGALQRHQAVVEAAVLQIAWAGQSLVLAIPGGYAVLRPAPPAPASEGHSHGHGHAPRREWVTTVLADHLACAPLVGAVPSERLAVLAWDAGVALLAGEDGAAARAPLALPAPPLALVSAGLFVVAVCDEGIHVFDRTNSAEVQAIEFAHDDAHITLAHRMPAADDPGGGRIVLATSRDVFLLEPVALEQQARA